MHATTLPSIFISHPIHGRRWVHAVMLPCALLGRPVLGRSWVHAAMLPITFYCFLAFLNGRGLHAYTVKKKDENKITR